MGEMGIDSIEGAVLIRVAMAAGIFRNREDFLAPSRSLLARSECISMQGSLILRFRITGRVERF